MPLIEAHKMFDSRGLNGPELLTRKTALVTGGAKRIGREIALTLARAGYNIAITYRESSKEAAEVARAIEATGVRALLLEMDQRSEPGIQQAVAILIATWGKLDLLINNAAIIEKAPIAEISLDDWDRVFESNTRGPFLVARECLLYLKATNGRIVNLGSLGGSSAWPQHAHYCASKAALHSLTLTMAKALAPEISVNCVAPGYIEMPENGTERPVAPAFAARTPMGRNGTAEEIAAAVLFFSTGPHFITGQILTVDGGLGL
jgi:NAD(P)-dependent dehydrogenase (short-subunit alcohol dehydrogenase family)